MNNLTIIEILSKTSVFNESVIKQLVAGFKKNINIPYTNNDHIKIRQNLASKKKFVDVQADSSKR